VPLATLAVLASGYLAWAVWSPRKKEPPPAYGYRVVNTYPHEPNAFSQGLAVADGVLYESTGQYGESSLRQIDLKSGKVLKFLPLDRRLFGEGVTVWNDRIVQLTWKSGVGFIYDRETFKRLGVFRYRGQGWGITHDGNQFIVSNGTSNLQFFDPQSFRVVKRLRVHSRGKSIAKLNELEYVNGEIYANIWGTDRIARISPRTGEVLAWIDLTGLLSREDRNASRAGVLNGIAYDHVNNRLFVTGKDWPKLFEIQLVPKD